MMAEMIVQIDFCDDNGGFWGLLLFGLDDPDGSRGDV